MGQQRPVVAQRLIQAYKTSIHRSAKTLKPSDVSNIDHLFTMHCSVGSWHSCGYYLTHFWSPTYTPSWLWHSLMAVAPTAGQCTPHNTAKKLFKNGSKCRPGPKVPQISIQSSTCRMHWNKSDPGPTSQFTGPKSNDWCLCLCIQ